jgi:hypothetical protein
MFVIDLLSHFLNHVSILSPSQVIDVARACCGG